MTIEQLVQEGRRLARPCVYLKDRGTGPAAGVWYEQERDAVRQEVEATGELFWLAVDSTLVPGLSPRPASGRYLGVYTNEEDCETGRVEAAAALPPGPDGRRAVALYARPAAPLPPLDAVFARGSEAVADWLRENGWPPGVRLNGNFGDRAVASGYERLWQAECPEFSDPDVYAVLGGWHLPGAEAGWHDRIDTPLVVWTLRDAEPRVEVWSDSAEEFTVIQRNT